MAIEFDCPFCTATIRVPDAYGGKEGRCPKCNTRLLVPTVHRPGMEPAAAVQAPPSPEAKTPSTAPSAVSSDVPDLNFGETRRPVATTTRRRSRRRASRPLVIGIPVFGFLLLIGIMGYLITTQFPGLTGDLTAVRAGADPLPPVVIPWSESGLDESEREVVREALSKSPESLPSDLMKCRLVGTDEGIKVLLSPADSAEWIAISITDQKPLALWIRKEREALDGARMSELTEELKQYCRMKYQKISGEPVNFDAAALRDRIGLNAAGTTLSYAAQAVHGNRVARLVGEDTQGRLLVSLPIGTTQLELNGRTVNGKLLFPGKYQVIVNQAPAAPESPPATPSTDADEPTDSPPESEMQPGKPAEEKSE